MIRYLQTEYPSIIFLFHYEVEAFNEEEGRKKLLPIVNRCKQFSKGLNIHFHDDSFLCYDDIAVIRLVFQIKEPELLLLSKSSTLFSFAATINATLINLFYYQGTLPG
ncbi:MAG: hypothetical protein LBE91_09850 [Tannerella sp.]|jgi:hypothetical protein|nr:hypothetical protein [Tannerella sp.]